MYDDTQVVAHFENQQVKPVVFKYNDIRYSVKDILRTKEVDNPFFGVSGIKDRMYWIVAQDGTKAVLHWHRNTGDWTIEKLLPAK
jgi:hypothetical protein